MPKRHLLPLLLVGLVGTRSVSAAANQNDDAVWKPRMPTPALVALDSESAREFVAEVHASAAAHDWQASIANDLNHWPCQIVSVTYARINRDTEAGWQVRLRVPADAPPELFDLTVSCNELTGTQNQAVNLSPTFATDFYILHLADEQLVNDKHTDPSGQYYKLVGTEDEVQWLKQPINLIHPRFVFITGDQIDYNGCLDGWNNWHNWGYEPGGHKHFSKEETIEIEKRLSEMYVNSHRGYCVPFVEAPGNHDVTPADKKLYQTDILWHPISVSLYEHYFGQRTWSFRMGDFYVLLHDWSEKGLKDWAGQDYAAAMADPTIKFRMVGQHFNTDQAFVPPACDLMLIGHGHTTATVQAQPYYIYEDGPTFRYGTTGFFNFKHMPTGWTCDQTAAPRDVTKDVWPLFNDHGVTKKVRSNRPDAMNVADDSITITNDLPQTFYDGRVRFVLDYGHYSSVENGQILAQYNTADGKKTAVLVKVAIPANGSITVKVGPPVK